MSSTQICAIHPLFSLFVNKDNLCEVDSGDDWRRIRDPYIIPVFTSLKIENKYFSHVWGIIDPIWGIMEEDNLQPNFMPYPLILKFLDTSKVQNSELDLNILTSIKMPQHRKCCVTRPTDTQYGQNLHFS